jgi:hypothetical protein
MLAPIERYYISKIIRHALAGDAGAVRDYASHFADRLEADGDHDGLQTVRRAMGLAASVEVHLARHDEEPSA